MFGPEATLIRRSLISFLLLAVAALSSLSANAQTPPGRHARFSIGGTLRDASNQHGMPSVEVALLDDTGIQLTTTVTRDNGEFEFDSLTNGNYTVRVDVKDYEEARQSVTIAGVSRMGIAISLNRTGKVGNLPMQMSISAHQLSVPRKAHDEFEKGMALIYLKSDLRGAIAQFQLAIKDFPTYYEAYGEEGSAYYQLNELGPAEEALQKSVDLSSGQYADGLFTLAALFTDSNRAADAEKLARKGMAVDSTSWRGPFELARALNALKQPEEAEKLAQRSRDLMPDNPPVYLLLANIHIQRKDYPGLLRDLDDYLRISPYGPQADQARKTRERVSSMLNGRKPDTAAQKDKDEDAKDDADADGDSPSSGTHAAPTGAEPDNSGLPSLPPPTAGNQ